jgi:antitoxin component YwqK of YwqJK toxin-antitoxin module
MLKRLIFFLFLSPFLGYAQYVYTTQKNYKAYFYDNGIISSEGFLEDGKPNGYWITYYPNQLRKSEGNRKNFKLDGVWKFYDEKGNIDQTITYVEDVKEGKSLHFNNECLLVIEENYVNGKLHGNRYQYFPDSSENKKIKEVIPYVNGRKEGIGYQYADDGRIVTLIEYQKGYIASREKVNRKDDQGKKQGVWKTYFSNRRLEREERYKDDLLNGYVKIYNKQGKLESASLYINGVKQSEAENEADFNIKNTYYSDGSVKSQITYNLSGKKDGVAKTFDKEGNVESTEIYRNGYLLSKGVIDSEGLYQGMWENYYLNGELKSKGEYKDGKKYGKWIYYFRNGKVEQEGFYDDNGLYTGLWKWYFDDGSLLRKEEFRRGLEDGYLEEFDRSGELITKGEFFDGEKEGEWFYELNDHREEGKYRYGERHGNWNHYFTNGKLSFEGSYVDGVPEGKHKYYNENGILIKEEEYSYGEKVGRWKWYDSNGIETMEIQYKNGKVKRINGAKVKFSDI